MKCFSPHLLRRKYQAIAPVLNHPGCLNLGRGKEWIEVEPESLKQAWQSPKFIILAHILAKAAQFAEKTLVYSKCLKTLDLLEAFLKSASWIKQVSSLDKVGGARELGSWKKGKDYLRIDGSVDPGKRGRLVDTFNNGQHVHAFLISSEAGGIGINLVSCSL